MSSQMTIFELLQTDVPWQGLSEAEIADRIASQFGTVCTEERDGHVFHVGNWNVIIRKSRYCESVYGGAEMIAVDAINKKDWCGFGCPCESIEEAVERVRWGTKSIDKCRNVG